MTKTSSWTSQKEYWKPRIEDRRIFCGMGRRTGDLSFVGTVGPDLPIPQLDSWVTHCTLLQGRAGQSVSVVNPGTLWPSRCHRCGSRSYPGPGDQGPRDLLKTHIAGSKRLGSWKLIGRVICWQKSCVLFFSLQLFLNRANVWVVNPNGHLTCWTGGHFFQSVRPLVPSIVINTHSSGSFTDFQEWIGELLNCPSIRILEIMFFMIYGHLIVCDPPLINCLFSDLVL